MQALLENAGFNFFISLVISVVTILILLPLSKHLGWMDKPDIRKHHEIPTPPIGGFGVFLGVILPGLYFLGFDAETIGFTLGGLLLVITGAVDDRMHIDWKIRIAIQVTSALLLIYVCGVRAEHVGPLFGFGDIELRWLSVPFTILITVGLINALNMFDGVDGLLGSVSVTVALMFVCAALYSGALDIAIALFCLLGALVGFLLFNMRFPWQKRARVFMGDAGSGFVGFAMAYLIFKLTQNPGHPVSPILGPYLLAPPIIDCLVLIFHRVRRGQSPFVAGRDHGHHLMLDAGFSAGEVVRFMVTITLLSGLFGATCMYIDIPDPLMVMAYLVAMFIWIWITETRERGVAYFKWVHAIIYEKNNHISKGY